MIRSGETICAPASGSGGAISVIRMSGPASIKIAESVFRPGSSGKSLSEKEGYTITFGEIWDGQELIDEVLVSLFRSPHSYTGEDSIEISCHSSRFIVNRIMQVLIKNGAIAAFPGEFTQRAFLNGKMDLSQAEAVADLIASSGEAAHRIALNQMRGGFSDEIAKLRGDLLHFASLIELELDFGEEDVEFADRSELKTIVGRVLEITSSLADSFRDGNVIKNGVPVVIVGKPNSGKSTLLNALLREEKAIVSDIPGTTRDVIEDTISINGLEYRFIDTAGLRETDDIIENLGIRKTHEKIIQASVILMVDEISDDSDSINRRADNIRGIIKGSGKKLYIVINKCDTGSKADEIDKKENVRIFENENLLFISAREKRGLESLREHLGEVIDRGKVEGDEVVISNLRHFEALTNVSESLHRVLEGLNSGIPEDLISMDIRQAIHYLGEITGEITTDEILGNIFKNFCIGK